LFNLFPTVEIINSFSSKRRPLTCKTVPLTSSYFLSYSTIYEYNVYIWSRLFW